VDEQVRAREDFEKAHREQMTYGRVAQALAGDYFSIYVVDPDTDRFTEYSSTGDYDSLGIEKEGEDFFGLSRKNMSRIIYPGDKDRFLGTFTREKVMSILERDGSFTMKYRLMLGGAPVYVSMKATLMEDEDGRHLIIGTNNIDAQMKREEAYRRKMEELRTSARNDFLANMSHDIRTPMNAIVGYTNIAKNNPEDAAAVRDALDKISSSSHFLLSLINDILDISKIESGKMQLSHNPCNLLEVFRRIENITLLQAKNKSLNIRYDHSSVKHTLVNTDELRLEQILINIISNAIKYTPEGKDVELIAGEEEMPGIGKNRYRFIIRDTGVGISEEYLPHLFESFTREENTKLNRVQGTGLGLAITAKVVEMMGGTISVKSKVGEGSEFTVVLEMDELREHGEREDAIPAERDLSGRRILLVEDNEINAEIAVMILTQYGLITERARDGQEGFEKVRTSGKGYYDAVLMDIQMPVMNGYEASAAIRALEGSYYKDIPIIAMSANAYDEDVRDSLRAGMNAHIAKPYQPEELMDLLGKYIPEKEETRS
ncbi:MAG: response regulator, partial [Clostridium sp.]|nr:response regulator [Clostridium sp.]